MCDIPWYQLADVLPRLGGVDLQPAVVAELLARRAQQRQRHRPDQQHPVAPVRPPTRISFKPMPGRVHIKDGPELRGKAQDVVPAGATLVMETPGGGVGSSADRETPTKC